jgi:succinate dehydrogenase flavin-adding protein (antitoxin of CptAB toxin-antitoxin module)
MLSKNLKKLTYRLHYRGIKELDIFFDSIVPNLSQLSIAEQALLTMLAQEAEDKLYGWVLRLETPPEKYKKIIEKLLTSRKKFLY